MSDPSADERRLADLQSVIHELETRMSYQAAALAAAEERASALASLVDEFMLAAQVDALMEGPRLKGWNRSQLDRAYNRAREALAQATVAG